MKKNFYFAPVATLVLTSVLVFTSCQDDKDALNTQSSQNNQQTAEVVGNDSIFTYVPADVCGNGGPATIDNTITVSHLDLGVDVEKSMQTGTSTLATRDCVEDFISSELSGLFKYGADKLFGYYFGNAAKPVYNELFGDGGAAQTAECLKKIDNNVGQIQNVMKDIERAMNNVEVTQKLRERAEYNTFATFTAEKYAALLRETDPDKRDAIVLAWGNEVTCNCNTYLTAVNYLQFLCSRYNSLNLYLPQLYDYWVYQTTAWEKDGIETRVNLRRSDAALAKTAYYMVKAYCGIEKCKSTSEEADKYYKKVQSLYEQYDKVSCHSNAIVCQIKGTNVIMSKDLVIRDMKNHPWMKQESKWSSIKDFMYGEVGSSADYVLSHSLTKNDVQTIYNFYNKNRSEKMTFEQIMDSLGFNLSTLEKGKRHVMTLADGASMENEHFYNRNYFFRFDNVAVVNESDYIKQNFTIGKMFLDRNWKMKRIFKWWDSYSTDNCQYFRVNVERYNGETAYLK